jgi:hypothetical protein
VTQATLDLGAPDACTRGAASSRIGSRVGEFMLVGGATLLLFPISWVMRRWLGLDDAEYAAGFLTFYAAYVINDPHFTVTYFLFYKDLKKRALSTEVPLAQRVRFVVAGFVVPVLLVGWGLGALTSRNAATLGWMIQLMYVLVGWHYVKQGFGVLTVLSARRGVRLSVWERRAILLHCYAGWAYAWANPASPAGWFEERGIVYVGIGHPRWFEILASAVLAASVVAVTLVLVSRWRRERTMIPLAPLFGLLVSIWLWSIYSAIDPLVRYVIPALHSIQYLYFVWLMRRNQARETQQSFGASVSSRLAVLALSAIALGWLLFHGAPAIADGAMARAHRGHPLGLLGATPVLAVFYVFVNIHHYVMDTVIWRRENPDTRYLQIVS